MCGKISQVPNWQGLVNAVELENPAGAAETVTPMRFADVIACGVHGRRRVVRMRWGLIPPGTKDPGAVKPHIHARAETIDVKPSFRQAFAARRGLLVVKTFNEGLEITPTKTEQYVLTPCDGNTVAIAVIYEHWKVESGASLLSFAMVTVPPTPLIATITDRMPALIGAEDWSVWLGETPASLQEIKSLLRTSTRDFTLEKERKAPPPPKPPTGQQELF